MMWPTAYVHARTHARTCFVGESCLKKAFEKRKTAGMYSKTSIIRTVERKAEDKVEEDGG